MDQDLDVGLYILAIRYDDLWTLRYPRSARSILECVGRTDDELEVHARHWCDPTPAQLLVQFNMQKLRDLGPKAAKIGRVALALNSLRNKSGDSKRYSTIQVLLSNNAGHMLGSAYRDKLREQLRSIERAESDRRLGRVADQQAVAPGRISRWIAALRG